MSWKSEILKTALSRFFTPLETVWPQDKSCCAFFPCILSFPRHNYLTNAWLKNGHKTIEGGGGSSHSRGQRMVARVQTWTGQICLLWAGKLWAFLLYHELQSQYFYKYTIGKKEIVTGGRGGGIIRESLMIIIKGGGRK